MSIEQLCSTADDYFKTLSDPTVWMAKPFSSLTEGPELLQNIGVLLAGLHLGKTMTVLDFGAGSCWFSRILSQLQCQVIACDVSTTALEIGKRLFERLPVLGQAVFQPRFLPFDGRRIELPDSTVDRIVCNDAFHHVPNQELVLSEFARILRRGGIAGFSEPGKGHSLTAQSQMEMRNYGVLENDIDLHELSAIARQVGFTQISCKLSSNMEITLKGYEMLSGDARHYSHEDRSYTIALEQAVLSNARRAMVARTIFFFHKDNLILDSRSHLGLSHTINLGESECEISAGESLSLDVTVRNTGNAIWLSENDYGIGVVKLGTHLYDEKGNLLELNCSRHSFAGNVLPGQTIRMIAPIKFEACGAFTVAIDLVSEQVCWFENFGSQPQYVRVRVK